MKKKVAIPTFLVYAHPIIKRGKAKRAARKMKRGKKMANSALNQDQKMVMRAIIARPNIRRDEICFWLKRDLDEESVDEALHFIFSYGYAEEHLEGLLRGCIKATKKGHIAVDDDDDLESLNIE